jgi:hypothetical protein
LERDEIPELQSKEVTREKSRDEKSTSAETRQAESRLAMALQSKTRRM